MLNDLNKIFFFLFLGCGVVGVNEPPHLRQGSCRGEVRAKGIGNALRTPPMPSSQPFLVLMP